MSPKKLLINVLISLLVSCSLMVAADKSKDHLPKELESEEGKIIQESKDGDIDDLSTERDRKVLVESLNALIFVDEVHEVQPQVTDFKKGVDVSRMKLPEGEDDDFVEIMKPFLDKPITYAALNKIAGKAVRFYHKHDYFIVDVVVPSGQDITNGVVQFAIIRGKLGDVILERDEDPYFKDERMLSSFRIEKGEELDGDMMMEDLRWMNNNPFRVVNLVLKEGDEFAETDVVLRVEDKFPLRGYVGADNTGTPTPDENRFYAGINWGDVMGWDHSINYQFTTTDDIDLLKGHSLSYVAPLPWRHTLKWFFSYSEVDPVPAQGLDTKSQTWYSALHYVIPLPDWRDLRHEILLGYEFKQTDSNVFFAGLEGVDLGGLRDISQFVVGYNGSFPDRWGTTAFSVTLYLSPGRMTDHNKVENFVPARPLSDPSYTYIEFTFQKVVPLPYDFAYIFSFDGQYSARNLLSSEQFGLGGYSSIRGYREYEVNVDHGYVVRNELRSPTFHIFSRFFSKIASDRNLSDGMQLLVFFDYGGGSRKDKVAADGAQGSTTLKGAGWGVRYSFSDYISARFDLGWRLKKTNVGSPASSPRDWRMHFGVTGSI